MRAQLPWANFWWNAVAVGAFTGANATSAVAIGGNDGGPGLGAQANGVSSIAIGGKNDGAKASVANGIGCGRNRGRRLSGGVITNGAATVAGTDFGVAIGTGSSLATNRPHSVLVQPQPEIIL